MNNCEYYQELISRMLDDDLTAGEETALNSHLDTCGECSMMYEAFSGVSGMIAESLEEPPETLHENIMAEIRRSEIKKKNRRLRPVLTAAACFALVLIGAFGLKNTLFAAKAAAPMAMVQGAVSEDTAAAEAFPAEAPAPEPAAAAPFGQNNMLFAAAAAPTGEFSTEAAEMEEDKTEADTEAGYINEFVQEEIITVADSDTMDTLREILSDEIAEEKLDCRLLYTVLCEEDGSTFRIFGCSDGTLVCFDELDGNWYDSACGVDKCRTILSYYNKK